MAALLLFYETFKFMLICGCILCLEEILEGVFATRCRRPTIFITLATTVLGVESLVGGRVDGVIHGVALVEIRVAIPSIGNRLLQALYDIHKGLGIFDVL